MHPDFPPDSAPLEVDRVEWVPASAESVSVFLLGRWIDRPVAERLVLLVGTERRRHAFEALEGAPAGVLAAFAVPNELRGRLAFDIALQIGPRELALPGAQTGTVREDAEPPPEAEVIERTVLAERRARRAELAEESLERRATEAERTVETLEAQLANLEERLDRARDERDELESALADAERRLREAHQREYAEQQQRIETQEGRERDVETLRRRLEAANQRAEDMAREVDRAHGVIAAAERRAAGGHEPDEAGAGPGSEARIVERLEEVRRELEALRTAPSAGAGPGSPARVAELEAELERLRADLRRAEQEIETLRRATAELELRLASERRERLDAEGRLREQVVAVRRLVAEVLGATAALREAFEDEGDRLQGDLTAVVMEHRRRLARELRAMETRAAGLQAEWGGDEPAQEPAAAPEALPSTRVEEELSSLREELDRVRRVAEDQTARSGEARSLIAGLAEAAQRLREQAEPPPEEPGDAEWEPEAAPEPEAEPEPEPATTVLAPRIAGDEGRHAAPWLAGGIERLARTDAPAAGRLVVALVPVRRLPEPDTVSYDLTVTGLGTFRVRLEGGEATVVPQPEPGRRGEIDFRLEGSAAALAPLAAGGVGRRPRDVRVRGSRRPLRRVLRALRDPVGLSDVARAGAAVEPGLVLAALAACVEPAWTTGHAFTVAWEVGDGTWTVRVGEGPAGVEPGVPDEGATATVRVSQAAFLPLLAGLEPPAGERATATGDAGAVALLRHWFDRAQGLT